MNVTIKPLDRTNWFQVYDLSVSMAQKAYFPIPNVQWIGISRYEEGGTELFGDRYAGLIGGGLDEDGVSGYINPLMVDERFQRQGVAAEAMHLMMGYLIRKHHVPYIHINHRKENLAAGRLYDRLGFIIYSETDTEFQRIYTVDYMIQILSLHDHPEWVCECQELLLEHLVTHTTPEVMETNCQYIREWEKERLYEMADFKDRIVLDVGAGSGRLSFAAAALAKEVYASEPVETMREFIHNKAKSDKIANIRVAEAFAEAIPYPDDSFDIVMSGHVVGDNWDAEIAEVTRVCKSGGWLLDCPGDETPSGDRGEQQGELTKREWEKMCYIGNGGGNVYRFRKQIWKYN